MKKWGATFIFCILFLGSSAFAKTSPVKITGEDIAEYVYFSTARKATLVDLVETSQLKDVQKKQVLAYLKGHNMMATKIPALSYTAGTSVVIFGAGNKVDYSLARKNQLIVNGKTLKFNSGDLFSETVKKIQSQMIVNKSQAFASPLFFISSAFAAGGGAEAEAATAAVGFISTQGYCPPIEDLSTAPCPFKSDADYLKDRSISQQGQKIEILMTELTCENDKFISAATRVTGPGMPGMIEKAVLMYDKNGRESFLRSYLQNQVYCEMKVADGSFDSITYDGSGVDHCNLGSTDAGKIRTPGNGFVKGDKVQRMGGMNLPLRRLRSCCKSDECKAQIKIYINENLRKSPGAKSDDNKSGDLVQ